MADDRVRLQLNGRLAELILDSPGRGNALDLACAEQLAEQTARIAADPSIGAVLIHATGKNFCVGGDLREFAAAGDAMGAQMRRVVEPTNAAIETLAALPIPIVAAVQGAVAGAGIGIALSADVVLVADSTKLRMAYTAVGLSPDCGSSWLLTRRVGAVRALDLALTNRVLTGPELVAWGIASRIGAPEALTDEARLLALELANGPTAALTSTKAVLRSAVDLALPDQLGVEIEAIVALGSARPAQEAVARFVSR
jgi:2-(1,2-epoxy-1,2-dihydrophenyl)acetyl-CoA isomerase